MEMETHVTASVFSAYLQCPTKAYLIARGEVPLEATFAELRRRISSAYKATASKRMSASSAVLMPLDFGRLPLAPSSNALIAFVDCETASCTVNQSESIRVVCRNKKTRVGCEYIPVLYSAGDKADQGDDLLVCFGALAIGQVTGAKIPETGWVIYGEDVRKRTVRIADKASKVIEIVDKIALLCRGKSSPSLVLNRHCSTCDFQSRCRPLAVERDDLSLLGSMTAKERLRYHDKGVTTITQLSYGYRPKRKRHAKITCRISTPQVKHDHKLKALAIKKGQIHVGGIPSIFIGGTAVFMDVEGIPDRELYYLISLRYEARGKYVERSFWANGPQNERAIWLECIRVLKEVDDPWVVHYGAYESRFFKIMKKRWELTAEDSEFVDRIVNRSINLLSIVYGKIYFPTYSNGLKEIARWLGFEWTERHVSGNKAILLRRCWELTSDCALRRALISYNRDDCRALNVVTEALIHICDDEPAGTNKFNAINVESLEVRFQRTFGKFASALPEFEKINGAAYWDYQRSRVYVRTNKTLRRSVASSIKPARKIAVEKDIRINDRPTLCLKCRSSKLWSVHRRSYVVLDLKFTYRGVKRWVIRYHYETYRCITCLAEMTIHSRTSKYGPSLCAYAVYLLIEMRLSQQKIAEHLATVFKLPLSKAAVFAMKREAAQKYDPMYRRLLRQIASGPLAHVDETKGVVYGGGHYVWIFADLTTVAYVYSASRETSILDDVLAGFNGVLISDFYGGYDAVPCQQQKCLIHLMRDLNEGLLKHPFNDELVFIARQFGALLRDIVATIDRYGLSRWHLGKHKKAAERFLDEVTTLQCGTEVGSSFKRRIDKNRDKLFTFLDHDNVPWNNNNAEHAVRAFTRLRNVMVTSTAKGTAEYCVLLTVQQTLRCRGIGFLDFLRSGRVDLDL
jgi:predicted RecB family nuclease